eukprot:3376666-Rhodomonas_salina.1
MASRQPFRGPALTRERCSAQVCGSALAAFLFYVVRPEEFGIEVPSLLPISALGYLASTSGYLASTSGT